VKITIFTNRKKILTNIYIYIQRTTQRCSKIISSQEEIIVMHILTDFPLENLLARIDKH